MMGPAMLDPCDLCPLFPQGHDVSPFPPSCLECPFLHVNWALQSQVNVTQSDAAADRS